MAGEKVDAGAMELEKVVISLNFSTFRCMLSLMGRYFLDFYNEEAI